MKLFRRSWPSLALAACACLHPALSAQPQGAAPAGEDAREADATPPATTSVPAPDIELPEPSAAPLAVDIASDPILNAATRVTPAVEFTELVQQAVARHPGLSESVGLAEQSRYTLYERRAARYPSVDLNVVGFQVIDRDFAGTGLDNIVERTRATRRFDEFLTVNQLITDFGATSQRIKAASNELRAAALGVDDSASRVALNMIATWYDVFALRYIIAITEEYRRNQQSGQDAIDTRIAQGAAAEVDAALVENSLAQIDVRLAGYRQELASAEARYRELTGVEPPPGLQRAPALGVLPESVEDARLASENTPSSRAAVFQARSARNRAEAAERDLLPVVTSSVAGGRYGLLEEDRDYDVVAQVSLRQRFFGGLPQRARAAEAGASAATARAERIREENAREAAIAFSELQALNDQLAALQTAYIATRQTRDAVFERFRFSRGTLFETIDSNDAFYVAATSYLQTLVRRDAARYVLLARTGALLDALRIEPYSPREDHD